MVQKRIGRIVEIERNIGKKLNRSSEGFEKGQKGY